jgi:ubiquinone/menaquinone biosynthesis C-methylase UbiE
MRAEAYQQVFSIQTAHWWGRNRRKLALDLLLRFGVGSGCRHIDVGCGTGQNLGLLDGLRPSCVVGLDISPIALNLARKAHPLCQLVRCDVNDELPFAEKSFDVATIFNVLYHDWVKSELAVLKEVRRILRIGGLLLVTEPAFPSLARELDVAVMTRQRYRLRAFVDLLQTADLEVVFSNYFTSFGAPIILAAKAAKLLAAKSSAGADVQELDARHDVRDAVLYRLARIEAGLVKASLPIPFGTTLICVARRH